MPSLPLGNTNTQTASSVACHQRSWTAQTVGRRRASHAIIALGQHRRSDGVGRRMPSSPLDSTDGRIIALGQNTRSDGVGHGIPSSPLDSTDDRPSSGVACHSSPWKAHTVGRSRALHAIIALGPAQMVGHRRAWNAIKSLGQHKRSAVVGRAYTQRSAMACAYLSWLA